MRCLSSRLIVSLAFSLNLIAASPSSAADSGKQPRFAYVANNQAGTISVFQVHNGLLRLRGDAHVAGSSPLSLALTPSQEVPLRRGQRLPGA